jgi:hypothetical protein
MPTTTEKEISVLPVDAEKLCDIDDKKYHSIPAKENDAATLVEEDSKGKLTEIDAANRADYPKKSLRRSKRAARNVPRSTNRWSQGSGCATA